MMGLFGGEMGPLGWVATGAFWVLLLGLAVWLIARLLSRQRQDDQHCG